MAKVAKNLVLYGASGKLGDMLVIRQRAGQTILAVAPGELEAEPTPAQTAQRQRFQEAIIYGKAQVADPDRKAMYAEQADGRKSAYNVAVADFLRAPNIDEVDLTHYTGQVGSTIRIRATDDFLVVQVSVTIVNADGTLVEAGHAVMEANGLDWLYTAVAENAFLEGDKIIIRAGDLPGNLTEESQSL